MTIRNSLQIPLSQGRQRWAATISVGIDLEEQLGISQNATNFALSAAQATGGLQFLTNSLIEVGTVESLDFGQTRKIKERYALGKGSLSAFQVVPQGITYVLRLSRVVLKQIPQAEAVFNFLPSNLLLQQLPFVIKLNDVGDGSGNTNITHFCFGCWFEESNIRYDTISKEDTRLIQTATVFVGNVLTFDQSNGGNPIGQVAGSLLDALIASSLANDSEDVLTDFNIF